jgi:hypothetical protein
MPASGHALDAPRSSKAITIAPAGYAESAARDAPVAASKIINCFRRNPA